MMELLLLYEYQIIGWLGRLNIILTLIAALLFTFRRVNKRLFNSKNTTIKKVIKFLSKMHPFTGIILVITALIHGYMALDTIFKVHTGPIAWFIIFLMMLVALFGKKYKIKNWLKFHKGLAVLFLIAILFHIFARNIM